MTMPYQHNCSHSDDGWCLDCVKELAHKVEKLETKNKHLGKLVGHYLLDLVEESVEWVEYCKENHINPEEYSETENLLIRFKNILDKTK